MFTDKRTLFHLACESGEFRLINHCFNKIDGEQFRTLNGLKSNDNTPRQLAIDNNFDVKLEIFEILNRNHLSENPAEDKNTVIHNLVKSNQMKKLRDLLEFLSSNCLIDTVGFGLKNKECQTAIDIAIQNKNAEAVYLLNHFEFIEKTLNNRIYENNANISKSIDELLATINICGDVIGEVKIRNLIFQGGGIKGLAYLGCLKELQVKNVIDDDLSQIERIGGMYCEVLGPIRSLVRIHKGEPYKNIINFENFKFVSANINH